MIKVATRSRSRRSWRTSSTRRSSIRPTAARPFSPVTRRGGFTRYENAALGKPLRTLLGGLEALGLIEWRYSLRRGEASSLAPTERLSMMVQEAGVTLADFGRLPHEEVISLSRKRKIGDWRE